MTKAKPMPKPARCPWCGTKAGLVALPLSRHVVECYSFECRARGPRRKTERAAVEAWGRVAK